MRVAFKVGGKFFQDTRAKYFVAGKKKIYQGSFKVHFAYTYGDWDVSRRALLWAVPVKAIVANLIGDARNSII